MKLNYIEEKLYSRAFEDGVNYAIEKMFGGGKDDDSLSPLAAGAAGGAIGTLGGVAAGVIDHKKHIKDYFDIKDLKTGKKIEDIDWHLYNKLRDSQSEGLRKHWRDTLREHITPRAAIGLGAGTLAGVGINSYLKNKKKERD